MKPPKSFLGRWRITETEVWGRGALDMMVPAHMTFAAGGDATFEMICVIGEMDCAFAGDRLEFTWAGNDEMDEASGRGWAAIKKDGTMRGQLYFHHGDNSSFVARREEAAAKAKRGSAMRAPTR